jgi:serine/threonine-protein kinase
VDTFALGATALAVVFGKPPKALREAPPELPSADVDFTRLPFSLPGEISQLLNKCIHPSALKRPSSTLVAQTIGLHLLRDRHRALLSVGGKTYVLDKANRVVQLSTKQQGSLTISYHGLRFEIGDVVGDVAVNNQRAFNGTSLPGSCVIVLGAPELQGRRTSITVDVSHPEVSL